VSQKAFISLSALIALAFCAFFAIAVLPPALRSGDIFGAFKAGFVNPFSTGYSVDVILCWVILSIWILYERKSLSIRGGWIAILLGFVPGVATGFGLYLVMRTLQLNSREA
jgi:hypothetical protein